MIRKSVKRFSEKIMLKKQKRLCVGDLLLVIGGVRIVGHDLRAAEAGLFAFLTKPAAGGPDLAGRQRVDDGRNAFDDPFGEAAIVVLEMLAAAAGAGGRDAEDFLGLGLARNG